MDAENVGLGMLREDASFLNADFVESILKECRKGLESRGLNEEHLLDPLFHRMQKRKNPAQEAVEIAKSDGLQGFISHSEINCGF
eukprot:jgi/Bigna1/128410/aug1.6_g3118